MNENLNKVVDFITTTWKQWKKSTADGFQGKDLKDFIPVLFTLPALLDSQTKAAIVSEFEGRTPESITALFTYAKTQLPEENDKQFLAILGIVQAALILQIALRKPAVPVIPSP